MSRFACLGLCLALFAACDPDGGSDVPDADAIPSPDADLDATFDAGLDAGELDARPDVQSGVARLTVSRVGDGIGTVTSLAPGIACGETCSLEVPAGTTIQLTAEAAAGSELESWGAACAGATCDLVLDGDLELNVRFSLIRVPLEVNVVGAGVVHDATGELVCNGGSCVGRYLPGTAVSLTAEGVPFHGWFGDCAGTGVCELVADAAHAVRAVFGHLSVIDMITFGSASDIYEGISDLVVADDGDLLVVGSHRLPGSFGGVALPGFHGAFVARLDPVTGKVRWLRHLTSSGGWTMGDALAVRGDRVYAALGFDGTVDVGAGPHSANNVTTLVVALDDDTGATDWAFTLPGSTEVGRAFPDALDVTADGRLFVGGGFVGTVDFGVGTGVNPSHELVRPWLMALSAADGSPEWVKTFTTSPYTAIRTLEATAAGDVIVASDFKGEIDLGGGILRHPVGSDSTAFVARLRGSDGGHVWSRRIGDRLFHHMVVDGDDGVFVGGMIKGPTVDLGNGHSVTSQLVGDGFVARLDPATGSTTWAVSTGGGILTDVGDGKILLVGKPVQHPFVLALRSASTGAPLHQREIDGTITYGNRNVYGAAGALAGGQAWIVLDFWDDATVDGISVSAPTGMHHRLARISL